MNNEQIVDSGKHGVKWGLIIGALYVVLIYLRYSTGATNPILFSGITLVSYLLVLVLLFICGLTLRKANGGWIEMKEVFKTMFIAVLIFEFFCAAFTFIYLKYIDPNFFEKFRASTENLLVIAKQSQSKIDQTLKDMDLLAEQSKHMGIMDFLKTYLYYVGITGLFALIFSFILKRKPPVFHQDNFLQS